MMPLDKKSIALLYRRRAKLYDFSANAYYLLVFRELAYWKIGVKALNLKKGDTVIEIGCGTGLNFSLLRKQVGPKGNIIGVDLTPDNLKTLMQTTDESVIESKEEMNSPGTIADLDLTQSDDDYVTCKICAFD